MLLGVTGNCNGAIDVSSQEQEGFYFEREAQRALQVYFIAQRKPSEAEMERDRMIWDTLKRKRS